MGVPAHCWRMVYKGRLPNGEVWQTGFWLEGNEPTSNGEAQIAAQLEFDSEGGTTASSWWNVFKALIGPNITFDTVTVYSYPAGGTTATYIGVSSGTPHVGTGTAAYQPNQICMVASLLTGTSGRSYRGRMYLPAAYGAYTAATGLYNLATTTTIAQVWATKFTDFNAASGFGKVVVVSQKLTVATQVLSVRIDTRPDVQRRRANKTTGVTYVSEAVTP